MLRLPFEYRIRGAAGRACPHHSRAHTMAVRPLCPLRVLSEPAARRGSTLSAPPCRAVPWYVRTRSVRFVRPCVRAPRKCPFHRRARALAARVRAWESLVSFRVSAHVLWKVCAHCGTAGVPFVGRARRGHACSTPLECPCRVPARTKAHAATACCAGVSARHGPVHTHFTAQRDEPCTLAGISARTRSTA